MVKRYDEAPRRAHDEMERTSYNAKPGFRCFARVNYYAARQLIPGPDINYLGTEQDEPHREKDFQNSDIGNDR